MRHAQTAEAPATPQLVSLSGLARVLESSEAVARQWAKERSLPALRVGRELRYRLDDIRAAVEQGR